MRRDGQRGRRKGSGTLERRGSHFLARWTVNGERNSRLLQTGDRREAERMLSEIVAPFQIRNEAERLEAFVGKLEGAKTRARRIEESRPAMPLDAIWEAFVTSPARPDTAGEARLRNCETWTKRLVAWLKANRPEVREARDLTRDDAAEAISGAFGTLSNSTRNLALSWFRQLWKILKADGRAKIAESPWDGIQKRHAVHTRRRELTIEELGRVYGILRGECRLLFALGVYTGQRIGDCVNLEWGNVDLIRRRITLVPQKTARKTGRQVVVPIHDNLLGMLSAIPFENRIGHILPGLAGRPLDSVCRMFRAAFRKAGIETEAESRDGGRKRRTVVSFHSLRHTFVSLAANAGVPLAVVQSIVGHSTSEMTRHYYHESEDAKESAVASLPAIGAAGGGTAAPSPRLRQVLSLIDGLDAAERDFVAERLQESRKMLVA